MGLAAGPGLPIAVISLLKRAPTSGFVFLAFLVVGTHLLRPEVVLLRLAAAVVVLTVGTIVIAFVEELLALMRTTLRLC